MIVVFCFGEVCVLVSEVVKLILLDRGQYVRFRKDVKELRFVVVFYCEFFFEVIILYGVD